MSEYCPWVKVDYRVHALTPAVGVWAFSPSERYFAWVEGPDQRAVHVTELPSLRTVCELRGQDFLALSWCDEETLRVVRGERDKIVASRHAVPDGGGLGAVTVPRDGLTTSVQASADGRVVLIRATTLARAGDAPRAFLVGAAGDDDVTTVTLAHPHVEVPRHARVTSIDCTLSPDGRVVAALHQHSRSLWNASLWFAAPHAPPSTPTPFTSGNARVLGWVSPSRVLLSGEAAEGDELAAMLVERDGFFHCAPALATGSPLAGSFDLHPQRDRFLLGARRVRGGRYQTLALCARVGDTRAEAITLSDGRAVGDGGLFDGGACWGRDGAIVTFTQSPPGVANLTRRESMRGPGHRLAHFKLIGERPVDLALTASPHRERFLMTWRSFDRGPADPVRRLALYAP
ncbi:MAG: hypothetical protein U0324_41415 [Polyangiales bacterium]